MTTELITDKLKHETTTDRPDQSGYMSDEPTDIDGAMVITEDTYSEIHRFNQQTNGYSPSDEIQECFDEAMPGRIYHTQNPIPLLHQGKEKELP